MLRLTVLFAAFLSLAACAGKGDLQEPPVPLGDFALGHNVVVAPNLVKGPVSRDASQEEWIAAVEKAISDRFDRYEGARLYHLGLSVEGYVLAQPGIPVVLSPKSVLIVRVTAWDDEAGRKLNEEPHQLTVLESLSGETVVGSGLTQSKEKQMENLSYNLAKQVERWLVRMNAENGWFGGEASEASPTELPAVDTAAVAAEVPAARPDPADPNIVIIDAPVETPPQAGSGGVVIPDETIIEPEILAPDADAGPLSPDALDPVPEAPENAASAAADTPAN